MVDGYWSNGTLYLCTVSFTNSEVLLLINALNSKLLLLRIKELKKIKRFVEELD